MKMLLIMTAGLLALSGCATAKPSMQQEVQACASNFMEKQAHVLDATKACSHIYGLNSSREVRTTDLDASTGDK